VGLQTNVRGPLRAPLLDFEHWHFEQQDARGCDRSYEDMAMAEEQYGRFSSSMVAGDFVDFDSEDEEEVVFCVKFFSPLFADSAK